MSSWVQATAIPPLPTELGERLLTEVIDHNPITYEANMSRVAHYTLVRESEEKGVYFMRDDLKGASCHGGLLMADPRRKAVLSFMLPHHEDGSKYSSTQKEYVEYFLKYSPWTPYITWFDLSDEDSDCVAILLHDMPADLMMNILCASRTQHEYLGEGSTYCDAWRMGIEAGLHPRHVDYLMRHCRFVWAGTGSPLWSARINSQHCPLDVNANRFIRGEPPICWTKTFQDFPHATVYNERKRINSVWEGDGPVFPEKAQLYNGRGYDYTPWPDRIPEFKEFLENVSSTQLETQSEG